jgi:protein-S-isoprenylcysteine O-methyltransferase Ste14
MSHEDIFLRIVVVLLLLTRTIYWRISEIKALNEKPKIQNRTSHIAFHILIRNALNIFVFLQLIGLNIFPFKQSWSTEILGAIICVIAVICSFLGRKALGSNWTDSAETQIKKKHVLVTDGIYKFIRHPIALGYSFFIIGAELLVGSWLIVPVTLVLIIGAYIQSRNEEALLKNQFGESYISYMRKTKMFLPYIW